MRKTGSRESRDNREASATSPTSIAVKTFSIRFGSRRNQRPVHQKIRSSTTVTATIDTIKIGHMIGPPLRKLSIRKLPLLESLLAPAAGEALAPGDALKVAVTLAPGAGGVPVVVAAPGDIAAPGAVDGAPGAAPVGGTPAG